MLGPGAGMVRAARSISSRGFGSFLAGAPLEGAA
jgi:hypothetical protein